MEVREELGDIEGKETIIRTHYVRKKELISVLKKALNDYYFW